MQSWKILNKSPRILSHTSVMNGIGMIGITSLPLEKMVQDGFDPFLIN